MTISILLEALAGSSALGVVAPFAITRLGDGARRSWLLPVSVCGQAALGLWAGLLVPSSWLPETLLLSWMLWLLALIDQIDYRLPDVLTLPLIAAGLAFSSGMEDISGHVAGALAGYGVLTALAAGYRVWRGRDGIGQGDAKLLAAGGAWLGWWALPSVVVLGCAIALAIIFTRRLFPGAPSLGEPIPFGPALCLSIWLVWLYGPLAL